MVNAPRLLLADEPTGNLDPDNGRRILDLLESFQDDGGTVVLVTHENLMPRTSHRVVELEAGQLVSQRPSEGRAEESEAW
jgi:ABC-type ATPase involved in cell division